MTTWRGVHNGKPFVCPTHGVGPEGILNQADLMSELLFINCTLSFQTGAIEVAGYNGYNFILTNDKIEIRFYETARNYVMFILC